MTTAPLMNKTAVSIHRNEKQANVSMKMIITYYSNCFLSGENLPARTHEMSVYQYLHPTFVPV